MTDAMKPAEYEHPDPPPSRIVAIVVDGETIRADDESILPLFENGEFWFTLGNREWNASAVSSVEREGPRVPKLPDAWRAWRRETVLDDAATQYDIEASVARVEIEALRSVWDASVEGVNAHALAASAFYTAHLKGMAGVGSAPRDREAYEAATRADWLLRWLTAGEALGVRVGQALAMLERERDEEERQARLEREG